MGKKPTITIIVKDDTHTGHCWQADATELPMGIRAADEGGTGRYEDAMDDAVRWKNRLQARGYGVVIDERGI